MLQYEEALLRCVEETAAPAATGSGGGSEKCIGQMQYKTTACSPLDQPIEVTRFSDRRAQRKRTYKVSLRELAYEIKNITVSDKAMLPSFHLAIFGNHKTERRSLRHNANVEAISGVEIDYEMARSASAMPLVSLSARASRL